MVQEPVRNSIRPMKSTPKANFQESPDDQNSNEENDSTPQEKLPFFPKMSRTSVVADPQNNNSEALQSPPSKQERDL